MRIRLATSTITYTTYGHRTMNDGSGNMFLSLSITNSPIAHISLSARTKKVVEIQGISYVISIGDIVYETGETEITISHNLK